jgi:hypothetical protein
MARPGQERPVSCAVLRPEGFVLYNFFMTSAVCGGKNHAVGRPKLTKATMGQQGFWLKRSVEAVIVAGLLMLQFHFLSERIDCRVLPSGDEGSWMSVAAQLCRGEGFTTRWLEFPFQKPQSLPRPDDYRYPALTLILSLAFKVFGISFHTALWTVAVIATLWAMAVFLVCRTCFGAKTALLTMALLVFSLLQLEWTSHVYTEGLFGCVLSLLILCSIKADFNKLFWWIIIGFMTGILYYVRPNGILFLAGLAPLAFQQRMGQRLPLKFVSAALAAFFVIISPWLVRNALCFGNPFHFGGSGGILRLSPDDPLTFSVFDFIHRYGIVLPISACIDGFVSFFTTLHFFEHGLEIIPFAFLCAGLAKRRKFYNSFVAVGIVVMFLLCCYRSYNDWSGSRYFSSLIIFVYAYGVNELVVLFRSLESKITDCIPALRYPASAAGLLLCACILLMPVVNPHRYYERMFSSSVKAAFPNDEYASKLKNLVSGNRPYLAGSMAQLNFQWRFNCIGVQEYFDSTTVPRVMQDLKPDLAVFSNEELSQPRFRSVINELAREGYAVTPQDSVAGVRFLRIGSSK